MHEVAIALGTNLGDRLSELQEARSALQDLRASDNWAQSSIYATAPVGCPPGSPDFYNAVVIFDFNGTPHELLTACKALEHHQGRLIDSSQGEINAPRPIDADILYFGADRIASEKLTIPHPRMTQRRFVLEPLAEVRPDLILPQEHKSISELLENLDSPEPPLTLITKDW